MILIYTVLAHLHAAAVAGVVVLIRLGNAVAAALACQPAQAVIGIIGRAAIGSAGGFAVVNVAAKGVLRGFEVVDTGRQGIGTDSGLPAPGIVAVMGGNRPKTYCTDKSKFTSITDSLVGARPKLFFDHSF